jgi:energy-coupling factor transporter ATP-binding protein EcfA2
MYLHFFGLNEKPFAITPDPRYLYLSERHAEALAHLLYGVNESGGFIQLTGEVGTGKTTVVRTLLSRVPHHADVAVILNPRVTPVEFLLTICEELGLGIADADRDSVKQMVDALNRRLLAAAYIARGMTAANDFFQEWELARQSVSEATNLIGEDENDHLLDDLADLKTRIMRASGINDTLRGWSEGMIGSKTFQQVTEEFAEMVIPKVWQREGRKISRQYCKRQMEHAYLSLQPRRFRREHLCQQRIGIKRDRRHERVQFGIRNLRLLLCSCIGSCCLGSGLVRGRSLSPHLLRGRQDQSKPCEGGYDTGELVRGS